MKKIIIASLMMLMGYTNAMVIKNSGNMDINYYDEYSVNTEQDAKEVMTAPGFKKDMREHLHEAIKNEMEAIKQMDEGRDGSIQQAHNQLVWERDNYWYMVKKLRSYKKWALPGKKGSINYYYHRYRIAIMRDYIKLERAKVHQWGDILSHRKSKEGTHCPFWLGYLCWF